jgi:hypothetical protein
LNIEMPESLFQDRHEWRMKLAAKSVALAALVLVTAGPSYARPLKSTSIPSSLADDKKRLLPDVMTEFYGSFDKAIGCWMTKHKDSTYCVKPLKLDVRSSKLFIVAGGQQVNEEGQPNGSHAASGVLGLIVLTPNGANLGVVATNLYAPYGSWGLSPERESVTFQRLGPNEAYGWVARSGDVHTGAEIQLAEVYGVIGKTVKLLTTITSSCSDKTGAGAAGPLTDISTNFVFDTHSSASSLYPILLRLSGLKAGHPFRGNYRLVFDKNSLTYRGTARDPCWP